MTVAISAMAVTWSDGALHTAVKMNVTDTSSNAASLLMDLQVASVSQLAISKVGQILGVAGSNTVPTFSFAGDPDTGFYNLAANNITMTIGGGDVVRFGGADSTIFCNAHLNNTAQLILDSNGNNGICDQCYSYQTPTTGFSITMTDHKWHLILDPAGTLATGTITMSPNPTDGQIINIRSSQVITALTISPNTSQTVKGAPSSFAVGGQADAIYRSANTTWYF